MSRAARLNVRRFVVPSGNVAPVESLVTNQLRLDERTLWNPGARGARDLLESPRLEIVEPQVRVVTRAREREGEFASVARELKTADDAFARKFDGRVFTNA